MMSDVAGAAAPGGTPGQPQQEQKQSLAECAPRTPTLANPPSSQELGRTPNQECRHNANSHSRRSGGGQVPSRTQGNTESQFFFEDEVFRIDRRGRVHFGVVTATTESYSSSEEDDVDSLSKGEVRVAFYLDSKEMVHTEQSIGLAHRTLLPGDVVRRRLPGENDLTGQAGYVRDVNVRADVMVVGSRMVIKNVPGERLRPISEWNLDVPVCMDTWLGTTIGVDECAVLKSSNGARVEITSNDFHKFKDAVSECSRAVFKPNVFFPGNIVIGRMPPPDRVKNLTPEITHPLTRKSRAMYTVESVHTTSINVAWSCRAGNGTGSDDTDSDPLREPKALIKGEELNKVEPISLYESYMLQMHERFYLKYSKCDLLLKYADWEDEQAEKYIPIYRAQKKMKRKASKLNASASTSGNTRSVPKFRRMSNKFSGMRLPRPSSDQTHNACKSSKRSKEDMLTSGDEDEFEEFMQPLDHSMTAEKELEVAEHALSPSSATTAADGAAIQAPRITMRSAKKRHVKKKMRSVKKTLSTPFPKKETTPKDGDKIVVETLVIYSSVTVVWQDGTVEPGVNSTQLYPIHYLDNHEFFPGDFVTKANEISTGATDYGVIQCVDHDARIAKVMWFNIYTNVDNPIPLCKGLEELSVYDLKDHSDYQYRPGTMVIRVSNFTGEDVNSTAGQVIDNYPDGRLRVWWAKGHITMCYPQDLFEITQKELDEDGYGSDGSGDSWETESENSHISSMDDEENILTGIDRATDALRMLEKMFHVLHPNRKAEVFNDLLDVYKNCRALDRLLKTNFFDEFHFQGIVCCKPITSKVCSDGATHDRAGSTPETLAAVPKESSTLQAELDPVLMDPSVQSSSSPTKRKSSTDMDEVLCKKSTDEITEKLDNQVKKAEVIEDPPLVRKYRNEYNEMFANARKSIAKAIENRTKNDSGVHSRGEITSDESNNHTESENKVDIKHPTINVMDDLEIELVASRDADVCEVFCYLIKDQMAKIRKTVAVTLSKSNDNPKQENEHVSDAEEAIEELSQAAEPANDAATQCNIIPENEAMEIANDAATQCNIISENEAMEESLNLNALSESLPAIDQPGPMACSSPSCSIIPDTPSIDENRFQVLPNAPAAHHFISNLITPANKAQYQRAVQREYHMLKTSLPNGVVVRAYEDRMDLMSVMMVGPKRTPYQNALFFFDFQFGRDYPKSPPVCHYISYCTDRLNPNLYEGGKVCVSLLGTWMGRDNEVWSASSTMLQVLVSIQGLILVDEPYYNEAGYEKQRGTQLGNENSRVYNEMAIIKIAHSTVKQLTNPPLIFRNELIEHFKEFGPELYVRMLAWSEYSLEAQRQNVTNMKDMSVDHKVPCELPEFPLLPCSRGFCIAVKRVLSQLQSELNALGANLVTSERNGIATGIGTAPRAAPEEI
ncbi:(E3-independent) E2 ubiquitin-conjugating enzyme UBE2O isoform X1 [Drosophila sechellia]|uniref:GM23551 n=1 Tax=Drosophila sechellia TaxID=7238 RepID=B4HFW4_DROSE|nr:(E3-independent) E2 ubiquitin-conjugating enzyme UBE2O isoform X1 [Drosophila sechellia]EDW43357.1 GM23551 [Drosophila sechellia]